MTGVVGDGQPVLPAKTFDSFPFVFQCPQCGPQGHLLCLAETVSSLKARAYFGLHCSPRAWHYSWRLASAW